jgi:hypothetical protein
MVNVTDSFSTSRIPAQDFKISTKRTEFKMTSEIKQIFCFVMFVTAVRRPLILERRVMMK